MHVLTPNFLAARLAAMTIRSPPRPPPTHTGLSCKSIPRFFASATSQLAKKLSPSIWRMRFISNLWLAFNDLRRPAHHAVTLDSQSVPRHDELFTICEARGFCQLAGTMAV